MPTHRRSSLEDEQSITSLVAAYLRKDGCTVRMPRSGQAMGLSPGPVFGNDPAQPP